MSIIEQMMAKPKLLHKPCTRCHQAEAMWNLRARQMSVCEECHKAVEWRSPSMGSYRSAVEGR